MGDFTIAYDIFRPLSALAVAGLPVAVSKLVSESVALGRLRDARRMMRLSCLLFFLTGLLGTLIMLFGSRVFAASLGSPDSYLAVAALAPAVFFCCMMSAWRGYYQGLGNMYPTAASQTAEALVKLICGIAFCALCMRWAAQSLAEPGGGFIRRLYPNTQDGGVIVSQFGAVGAVLGVTLSTAAGAVYLFVRHHLHGDGLAKDRLRASPPPAGLRVLLRRMILIAVPVCLGAVAVHLTSMIDLFSVMNRLDAALRADQSAFMSMYRGLIPPEYQPADIAKYLYGSYSGIAVNIFNLVPSLTATFGVSILPAVAGAWAARDRRRVHRNIESMLRATCLISMPAGLSLCLLADPITSLLYGSKPMEAAVAAGLLRALGIPAILVSLTTPVSAVLQAVGRVSDPVWLMLLGGVIKFAVNCALVGQPQINIQGAPFGTGLCYLTIVICSLRRLTKATGMRVPWSRTILKPFFCGLGCALSAWAAQGLLAHVLDGNTATLLSVAVGAAFYAASVLLSRTICREDLLMLPGGEKIAKILEKHGMMG